MGVYQHAESVIDIYVCYMYMCCVIADDNLFRSYLCFIDMFIY